LESIHSSGNASVISNTSGAHRIVEVGDVQLRCGRRIWRGRTDQLTVYVSGWIWKTCDILFRSYAGGGEFDITCQKSKDLPRKVFYLSYPPPPHSGRNETFLCIFEKNIFLDILDDSKNILENRFFDQTSS
jgi:hypothetical protein